MEFKDNKPTQSSGGESRPHSQICLSSAPKQLCGDTCAFSVVKVRLRATKGQYIRNHKVTSAGRCTGRSPILASAGHHPFSCNALWYLRAIGSSEALDLYLCGQTSGQGSLPMLVLVTKFTEWPQVVKVEKRRISKAQEVQQTSKTKTTSEDSEEDAMIPVEQDLDM